MDNSPLARLPGELRNYMYELALSQRSNIVLSRRRKTSMKLGHRGRGLAMALALTQTCSEIRKESSAIFYAVNTFEINMLEMNDQEVARKASSLIASFMSLDLQTAGLRIDSLESFNIVMPMCAPLPGRKYMPPHCTPQGNSNMMVEYVKSLIELSRQYPKCHFTLDFQYDTSAGPFTRPDGSLSLRYYIESRHKIDMANLDISWQESAGRISEEARQAEVQYAVPTRDRHHLALGPKLAVEEAVKIATPQIIGLQSKLESEK